MSATYAIESQYTGHSAYILHLPLPLRLGPLSILLELLELSCLFGKQRFLLLNFCLQEVDTVGHRGQLSFQRTLYGSPR